MNCQLTFWSVLMNCHLLVFSCPGSSIPDLGQSVSHWVSQCHFRILTQRVAFKTWNPSDIWSEWCLNKKNKRQKDKKDKKTKGQKIKKTKKKTNLKVKFTKRQKNEIGEKSQNAKRQKDKDQKESSILWRQGSFALLRCLASQDALEVMRVTDWLTD